MGIHDWSKVPAGTFHDFHQAWAAFIRQTLNKDVLPAGYEASLEQKVPLVEPDVIAVEYDDVQSPGGGGIVTAPRTKRTQKLETEAGSYARKADRIVIRHRLGKVVAVIEIVSPGNKAGKEAFAEFLSKSVRFLQKGVHLLVIDLFPPTPRDPHGIHQAIADELLVLPIEESSDPPLTFVSYEAGDPITAYIEPAAVGDTLPDMPLFLATERFVTLPLAGSYQLAWDSSGPKMRALVEGRTTVSTD